MNFCILGASAKAVFHAHHPWMWTIIPKSASPRSSLSPQSLRSSVPVGATNHVQWIIGSCPVCPEFLLPEVDLDDSSTLREPWTYKCWSQFQYEIIHICLGRSTIFKPIATWQHLNPRSCHLHVLPPQRCSTPSSPPGHQQPPPSADHPFALTNTVPMICSSKVDKRQGHTACGNELYIFPTWLWLKSLGIQEKWLLKVTNSSVLFWETVRKWPIPI